VAAQQQGTDGRPRPRDTGEDRQPLHRPHEGRVDGIGPVAAAQSPPVGDPLDEPRDHQERADRSDEGATREFRGRLDERRVEGDPDDAGDERCDAEERQVRAVGVERATRPPGRRLPGERRHLVPVEGERGEGRPGV